MIEVEQVRSIVGTAMWSIFLDLPSQEHSLYMLKVKLHRIDPGNNVMRKQ